MCENYFLGFFHNHIFRHYKSQGEKGLTAFCNKHKLAYASVKKIYQGSESYPGVTLLVKEAILKDLSESPSYPEKYLKLIEESYESLR